MPNKANKHTPNPLVTSHSKFYLLVASVGGRVIGWLFDIYTLLPLPTHPRTRVAITNSADTHILLVRNLPYPSKWTLPGGGYKKHETAEQCAARELHEELHLTVAPNRLHLLGRFSGSKPKRQFDCLMVAINSQQTIKPNSEVIEANWFALNTLPANISPTASKVTDFIRRAQV